MLRARRNRLGEREFLLLLNRLINVVKFPWLPCQSFLVIEQRQQLLMINRYINVIKFSMKDRIMEVKEVPKPMAWEVS